MAIVDPWLSPRYFRAGSVYLTSAEAPGLVLARVAYSRHRENRSWVTPHYRVGESGRGIRQFEETSVGLLVSRARLVELMQKAGLRATFLERGLTVGRGLLIGVKPASDPVSPSRQRGRAGGRPARRRILPESHG